MVSGRARARIPALVLLAVCCAGAAGAPVPEHIAEVRLPPAPRPHWVWVNDGSFDRPEAGRAALVDAASGEYLGWLSTGVFFLALTLPADHHAIYSVETHYSRGVRGERSDVVSIYDPRTLRPVAEIPIPAKRATGMPTRHHAALTDDDRFLLVYNFTPAQSVSVVDTRTRRFAGEIETPGCVLVYPDGPRRFHMLCGDGSALRVVLDDEGRLQEKSRTRAFFDPRRDPIQEDAARLGRRWVHVSYGGRVHALEAGAGAPVFPAPWSLFDAGQRAAGWRTGGGQLVAAHAPSGALYVLVHQGGEHSQEAPGTEVWVYDPARRARTARIALVEPATAIAVTRDAQPRLLAVHAGASSLQVYDARTGAHLRSVRDVANFPTVLQPAWRPRREARAP